MIGLHSVDARADGVGLELQRRGLGESGEIAAFDPVSCILRREDDGHAIVDAAHELVGARGHDRAGRNITQRAGFVLGAMHLPDAGKAHDLRAGDGNVLGLLCAGQDAPLVEAAGWDDAAAFGERVAERRELAGGFAAGVDPVLARVLGPCGDEAPAKPRELEMGRLRARRAACLTRGRLQDQNILRGRNVE